MSEHVTLNRVIFEDDHVEFNLLLKIGNRTYHLEENEVKDILNGLNKAVINLGFNRNSLTKKED